MRSALIGGVVLGLLSAIPFVNWVNACCCAWAIAGGLLASYLYIKNSPTPLTMGDGAIIGAIAGVVGAIIYFIIGVPLALMVGATMNSAVVGVLGSINPEQAEVLRQQAAAQGQSIAGAIFGGLIGGIFLIIFSTIGGLLGVPLFEKRKGGPGSMNVPPPPPPTHGGGQPGAGTGFGSGQPGAGGGFGGSNFGTGS